MNINICKSASLKLSVYLRDRVIPELFERFSAVLDGNATQNEIEYTEKNLKAGSAAENIILEITKDNRIARTCIELALFEYFYPFAEELFGYVIPDHGKGVSLKLSALVSGENIAECAELMIDAYFTVSKILSHLSIKNDASETCFCADFTLVSLLNNNYMPSSELKKFVSFSSEHTNTEEMILWKDDSQQLAGQICSVSGAISVIYGEQFSGRRFFAEYTARLCGLSLFTVDFEYFDSAQENNTLNIRIKNAVRDCFLLQSALCISNVSINNQSEHRRIIHIIESIAEEFAFSSLPVFITAETDVNIHSCIKYVCFSFTIPRLNAKQSIIVWNYFGKDYNADARDCFQNIGGKIILPAGKIKRAILEASIKGIENDTRKLSEICYNLIEDTQYKGIKRIYPKYKWDDLKLSEKEKNMLNQICSHARYKNIILNQWNMARLYPYGGCISVLLAGPPGTGKTMAAHVIADALNLALYKVDLSQVMDKYIGETEKHLEKIFENAEKGNMILFLDEADALLGKRSEINNSHDKYANNEVSYILQRIEEFDGIIIMATNFVSNIDSAFTRRIRYTVDFNLPDKNIRNQIWHSFFNDDLPHDEIDFEFLSSDDFKLSGAIIKNIMLNAMIRAASEGIPLNMEHIVCCLAEEYRKMGSNIIAEKIQKFLK